MNKRILMNRVASLVLSAGAVSMVAACGGSSSGLADSATRSAVTSVENGRVATGGLVDVNDENLSETNVGLVAYATGVDQNRGQIVALTGIQAGSNVGQPITTGTATYSTRYGYQYVDNVSRTDSLITGQLSERGGNVTLSADFSNGTLRGGNNSIDVDGRISGQTLTGNVEVQHGTAFERRSLNTTLNGQIGSTGVIGTFHGSDSDTTVAGGFVGTRD